MEVAGVVASACPRPDVIKGSDGDRLRWPPSSGRTPLDDAISRRFLATGSTKKVNSTMCRRTGCRAQPVYEELEDELS